VKRGVSQKLPKVLRLSEVPMYFFWVVETSFEEVRCDPFTAAFISSVRSDFLLEL
jgi:hypothetical protein